MKCIRVLFLLFYFVLHLSLNAQNEKAKFTIGGATAYGFIIPHSPGMLYITNQHIQKQEIFFEKHSFGEKKWQQRYGFPSRGLSFSHFNLKNPEHLGHGFSLAPYLNFQLNKHDFWQLKLRTALGLGYLTKRFEAQDNFKNVAIGSHFNLFFSVALQSTFRLNPNFDLNLIANFSHFSNTGYSKPNLGINIPTVEAGINYHFGDRAQIKIQDEKSYIRRKARWQLTGGAGINAVYPPNGVKYFAGYLGMGREKRLNYKSTIGGSIDFFYNTAQKAALKRKGKEIKSGLETLQYGLSIYHLLHFGKFGVLTKAGYYLQTKNEKLGNYYHLVGGRIKIHKGLHGFFALKTHFAKAEYLMFGLNYQFLPKDLQKNPKP